MDIKLKMGAKNSLPSTKNNGTVYFAKDGNKNYGELYYDDANGARIKIAPSISSIVNYYDDNNVLNTKITLENNTSFESPIPEASASATGIVSTGEQTFAGKKTFTGEVYAKTLYTTNGSYLQLKFGNETLNYVQAHPNSMIGFCLNATASQANSSLMISAGGALPGKTNTYNLGSSALKWKELYVGTINATSVSATTFTGALTGNASTASKFASTVNINGTAFDGSGAITTIAWGMSRTISIDDDAGTTGTAIDGSADATLVIPSTIKGFTSITSTGITVTDLAATNIGTATTRNTAIHTNGLKVYQSGYSGATTIARDAASTTNYTLSLPSATGRLVYHTKDTAIGSANAPVYIASTGLATECGAVNVAHGGTGQTTLTSGRALIGNGTSAVSFRAITNNTSASAVTANTNLITANTLAYWTGSSNISTVGTISSGTWQGTSVKVGYGGTGTTTAPTKGGVIYGSSTSAYGCTAAGTSGYLLQSNGTSAPSWINATNSNTASTIVKRDSSGNFSAGTITATLSGNATTATTLATARTIDGISFNGNTNIVHYGTCSTAAATVAKTVTISGFVLEVGATATVKFSYTNSASNPTLNVNSTGAKSIYYNGAAITSSYLVANRVYTFVYDGTNYLVVGDIDTNSDAQSYKYVTTTNANYPILFNYNNTSTSTSHYSYDRYSTSLYINPSTGALTAPVFVTANYGTADPNTSGATTSGGVAIKGAGTNGALYFQIVT